jgi:hypothetical protein
MRDSSSPSAPQNSIAELFLRSLLVLLMVLLVGGSLGVVKARPASDEIDDVTGKYHFLSADDTLAILEEEGKLKGYIDVYQGEEESDAVLSYPITLGERKRDLVEFKTGKIHQKYYRFRGQAERGRGHEPADPDYLRLVGDLEVVTVKSDSGEEAVERRHVVFKSMGKSESPEDRDQ